MKRHFERGRSTFTCLSCDRTTRDVGQGTNCCKQCNEIAELDNMCNDNGYDFGSKDHADALHDCNASLAEIEKLGGNVAKVKEQNQYIWQ